MAEIKEGNVVQLKSGGPEMVVNFVEMDGNTQVAGCSWFVKEKKMSGRFPTITLKLISN